MGPSGGAAVGVAQWVLVAVGVAGDPAWRRLGAASSRTIAPRDPRALARPRSCGTAPCVRAESPPLPATLPAGFGVDRPRPEGPSGRSAQRAHLVTPAPVSDQQIFPRTLLTPGPSTRAPPKQRPRLCAKHSKGGLRFAPGRWAWPGERGVHSSPHSRLRSAPRLSAQPAQPSAAGPVACPGPQPCQRVQPHPGPRQQEKETLSWRPRDCSLRPGRLPARRAVRSGPRRGRRAGARPLQLQPVLSGARARLRPPGLRPGPAQCRICPNAAPVLSAASKDGILSLAGSVLLPGHLSGAVSP